MATTTATTTTYRSSVPAAGRDGFGHLLRAEWTKLRSVRRWVLGMIAAVVLTILIGLLAAAGSGTDANQSGEFVAGSSGQPVIDEFRFVHRPMSGDGSVIARVRAQQARHKGAGAGIMIKEAARSGAPYAALVVTAEQGVRLQSNFTTDLADGAETAPRWLRLTRSGTSITGYSSADGSAWREVGTVELPGLPQTVEIGLFVMSPPDMRIERQAGSTSVVIGSTDNTATFDNVRVEAAQPQQPAPWIAENVGHVGGTKDRPGRGGKAADPSGRGIPDESSSPDEGGGTAGTGEATDVGGTVTVTGSGAIAPHEPDDDIVSVSLIGVVVGLMAIAAVGVLFTTSEYKRGMIRTTFTASQRRGRVLTAKAIVIGTSTLVAGLVASVTAFFVTQPVLRGNGFAPPAFPHPSLSEPSVLRAVVGAAAFLAVVGVFSLGVGTILRRSAAAITLVIVLLVLPMIIGGFLPLQVSRWLMLTTPAGGFAILRAKAPTDTLVEPWASIDPWTGFGVLCAYAAIALVVAAWLLRRRDA
jgi:hypothetical protein